jgi:hypothetical protein
MNLAPSSAPPESTVTAVVADTFAADAFALDNVLALNEAAVNGGAGDVVEVAEAAAFDTVPYEQNALDPCCCNRCGFFVAASITLLF